MTKYDINNIWSREELIAFIRSEDASLANAKLESYSDDELDVIKRSIVIELIKKELEARNIKNK